MRKRFLFLPTNLHELTRILKKEKKKPIFTFLIRVIRVNSWAKSFNKPGGSEIEERPQNSTQIFDEGYPKAPAGFKGILGHLKEQNLENSINRAFLVLVILGVLSRLKRV
jgi:hypothetical protein